MRLARIAALAAVFIAPAFAPAQQALPLAGIAHVALRVRDLAASTAFYEGLGFLLAFDVRQDNTPTELFFKINDRQFIELYPITGKDQEPGFMHLCFESNDIEALHEEYVANGLTTIAVRKGSAGNAMFTLPGPLQPLGPDAKPVPQTIEYTQYAPDSLHGLDAGKHLGPDRIGDRLLGVGLAMTDPESARMFYINQLYFKPLPGEPMTMHLPGSSGDEVQIQPDPLGQHARLIFQSSNLGRSARRLSHEHIKFTKSDETLSFADPDGNEIDVRQR